MDPEYLDDDPQTHWLVRFHCGHEERVWTDHAGDPPAMAGRDTDWCSDCQRFVLVLGVTELPGDLPLDGIVQGVGVQASPVAP